jgi:hypothetical protein
MSTEKTFSAKQIASRIGTDAKTLRKFFRSTKSSYEAVGQGARYEFPVSQLETIRADFIAWQKGKRYPSAAEKAQKASPQKVTPTPKGVRPIQAPKIPSLSEHGKDLMARFPLIPGESTLDRTKRVGGMLAQERFLRGECTACAHPILDHWESEEMQKLRPTSAKNKTGCSRVACWCTKLKG